MEKGELTFITGGVRSGKSAFAEHLATEYAQESGKNLHYIACSIPFDGEMQERILRHQEDRVHSGFQWDTWEQPKYITEIAERFTSQDIILLDCVTTLLNNYLFQQNMNDPNEALKLVVQDITSLCEQAGTVLVVSNEVLQDMPYTDEFTLDYQSILGNVHQQIVKLANTAILVESGIPIYKKGRFA